MTENLPADTTVADVVATLDRPEHYVCGVLEKLYECKKLNGNARVKIGTSGRGLRPYYRIVYDCPAGEAVYNTFFDNHRSFAEEGQPVEGGQRWSSRSMTLEEVAVLRGSLRSPHRA